MKKLQDAHKEFIENLPDEYLDYLRVTKSPHYREALELINNWRTKLKEENPEWYLR